MRGCFPPACGTRAKGEAWYDGTVVPTIGPVTLVALLFTVLVMFATQGENIVASPGDVLLIAVPLYLVYALLDNESGSDDSRPLSVLRERYARGELTDEEFERRREQLK